MSTIPTVAGVWRVNCEWDIGQEYFVFLTGELAEAWATQALIDCGIEDDIEDLKDECYVSFEMITLIKDITEIEED